MHLLLNSAQEYLFLLNIMLVHHSVTVISLPPPPPPPPPPSPPPPLLAISHLTTQDTCRLPPLPENANYSTVPESISAKSTISLVCQNGYLLVTDGNLTCQESGTWSGEVQCQREGKHCTVYWVN